MWCLSVIRLNEEDEEDEGDAEGEENINGEGESNEEVLPLSLKRKTMLV